MNYRLIRYPKYVPEQVYHQSIEKLTNRLLRTELVESIYQVGGIRNPGISDIDLIVVFKDGAKFIENPLKELTGNERYLFTHSLFGCTKGHFLKSQQYNSFHNYKVIWGPDIFQEEQLAPLSETEKESIERQMASEFLVANYLSKSTQKIYGVIDVRNFLLSVKAIQFDLEYLNITDGALLASVQKAQDWRNTWFEQPGRDKDFRKWFDNFYTSLSDFLGAFLEDEPFYLPPWANYQYSRHVLLKPGKEMKFSFSGTALNPLLVYFGKKGIKLMNRLNRFKFTLPVTHEYTHPVLLERFEFFKEAKEYNLGHIPHFSTLSGPVVFKVT